MPGTTDTWPSLAAPAASAPLPGVCAFAVAEPGLLAVGAVAADCEPGFAGAVDAGLAGLVLAAWGAAETAGPELPAVVCAGASDCWLPFDVVASLVPAWPVPAWPVPAWPACDRPPPAGGVLGAAGLDDVGADGPGAEPLEVLAPAAPALAGCWPVGVALRGSLAASWPGRSGSPPAGAPGRPVADSGAAPDAERAGAV